MYFCPDIRDASIKLDLFPLPLNLKYTYVCDIHMYMYRCSKKHGTADKEILCIKEKLKICKIRGNYNVIDLT